MLNGARPAAVSAAQLARMRAHGAVLSRLRASPPGDRRRPGRPAADGERPRRRLARRGPRRRGRSVRQSEPPFVSADERRPDPASQTRASVAACLRGRRSVSPESAPRARRHRAQARRRRRRVSSRSRSSTRACSRSTPIISQTTPSSGASAPSCRPPPVRTGRQRITRSSRARSSRRWRGTTTSRRPCSRTSARTGKDAYLMPIKVDLETYLGGIDPG